MVIKVSVIMPALNEENDIHDAIQNVIESYKKLSLNGEIIIVNDGSTDATKRISESLVSQHSNIHLINHRKSEGIGKSYWDGVKASKGECVTWVPADGENDAYEILRYLSLMDHVDIIVPYVYNKETRSRKRRLLSKTYKAIINLSFGMILNYMNGTVIFRRSILEEINLRSGGFFFTTELLIKTIKKGYLYAEVPCGLNRRASGQSKALSLRSLYKVITGYTGMLFSVYFSGNKKTNLYNGSMTFKRKKIMNVKN